MLGGCMWPLAIVGSGIRAVGHITPHAWAVDALLILERRHAGLEAIAPQVAVLVVFALVLMTLGGRQLRRQLSC
jgi:ABC-2 type transport system permease protein